MASATERLLKTEKKTLALEALGDSKFSLSALGIEKPVVILADQVLEVRAIGKQLFILRKPREYDAVEGEILAETHPATYGLMGGM